MCSVSLMIRLNQDQTISTLDVKELFTRRPQWPVKLYKFNCKVHFYSSELKWIGTQHTWGTFQFHSASNNLTLSSCCALVRFSKWVIKASWLNTQQILTLSLQLHISNGELGVQSPFLVPGIKVVLHDSFCFISLANKAQRAANQQLIWWRLSIVLQDSSFIATVSMVVQQNDNHSFTGCCKSDFASVDCNS